MVAEEDNRISKNWPMFVLAAAIGAYLAALCVRTLGWISVRVLREHQPFMRNFHRYAFYIILAGLALTALTLAVWLVTWLYETLSLKALVAFGLVAAIVILVSILRELRRSRTPPSH